MRPPVRGLLTLTMAASSLGACTSGAEPAPVTLVQLSASAAPEPSSAPTATPDPEIVADDAPLRAGRVQFEGMVRPTKGGLDVRGVTVALETLEATLANGGGKRTSYDELLGSRVRLAAELVREQADEPRPDEVHVQSRSGAWFRVVAIQRAEIVIPAQMIEGELSRSKGFFALAGHLVRTDDLAWALVGQADLVGRRVRLWGQPRTVQCAPNAQCLLGGSLPLFDVGRAELLP